MEPGSLQKRGGNRRSNVFEIFIFSFERLFHRDTKIYPVVCYKIRDQSLKSLQETFKSGTTASFAEACLFG